jgi:hypothetical protein
VLEIIIVRVFLPGCGLRKKATLSSACAIRSSSTDLKGHASWVFDSLGLAYTRRAVAGSPCFY